MSKPKPSVDAICLILAQSVVRARDAYKEDFGVAHDDKSIDREIVERFERQYDDDNIELPAHLVLALVLREGFGRQSNKRQTARWVRRTIPHMIEDALELEAELLHKGRWTGWLEAHPNAFTPKHAREIQSEFKLDGRNLTPKEARERTAKIMAKCSKFSQNQYRVWLRKPRQKGKQPSAR